MEGGEAAPRAINKEKKNKENNSRMYYGIYLLALILYYFFYLIGLIHIMGYIIKFFLVYLDKYSFVLTYILTYFISLIMAQAYLVFALGKNLDNSPLKEKIFAFSVAFILFFIFNHIKIVSSINWTLSSFLNLLIKLIDILKYVAFLPICKIASNFIIEFIK